MILIQLNTAQQCLVLESLAVTARKWRKSLESYPNNEGMSDQDYRFLLYRYETLQVLRERFGAVLEEDE